ncbi:MAG: AzlD domain-containing protein [Acidimicrobiia bacterium]|nr:AzlD domain-containing protein [Acidimicrobiia bacterium]
MTWPVVVGLTAAIFGMRLAGMFGAGNRIRGRLANVVNLLPVAVVSAVVVLATFTSAGQLTLDARVVGMAAASVAVLRRAPMAVVLIVATATTAAVRALGWDG